MSKSATHVLNVTRPWCRTLWSPDGSKLLIGGKPWVIDIDPNRPLEEVLAPALSTDDFLTMLRERWDRRIAADPLDAERRVSRAVIAMAGKDFEQVRQDLTECIGMIGDPNDPACQALDYWAQTYARKGTSKSDIWRQQHARLAEKFPGQFRDLEQN